ncbi:hypothetical protein LXA25_18355 [Erwinia amylovora]|nr:hypothetical protein [Erwinia amylovora]MCK8349910.1 hypothetical protein [Erwinia amylovora]
MRFLIPLLTAVLLVSPLTPAKHVAELAQIAAIAYETTAAGNSTDVAELE